MSRFPSSLTPGTLSRRHAIGSALAATAALAVPMLARAQSGAGDGATFRLGFIGPAKKPASATGWALEQGALQRALAPLGFGGVSTHVFANGPDLNEAFISGALDAGIYGDTPAVVARATGLDARLVGFDTVGMNAWLLTPQGGVKTVKELDGKVVGVALGSYMHRYLLGTLKEAGILKTTKVVHMLPRDGGPTLEKGAVAAFAAPINTGPLLASRGFPVIDQATQHSTLPGTSVIVASGKVLARAPTLPAVWTRARQAALQEIRQNPERYYAFHSEVSGFPVEAVKASYPLAQFPDQPYPAEGLRLLEEVKAFLLAERLIRKDFALAEWRPDLNNAA